MGYIHVPRCVCGVVGFLAASERSGVCDSDNRVTLGKKLQDLGIVQVDRDSRCRASHTSVRAGKFLTVDVHEPLLLAENCINGTRRTHNIP